MGFGEVEFGGQFLGGKFGGPQEGRFFRGPGRVSFWESAGGGSGRVGFWRSREVKFGGQVWGFREGQFLGVPEGGSRKVEFFEGRERASLKQT